MNETPCRAAPPRRDRRVLRDRRRRSRTIQHADRRRGERRATVLQAYLWSAGRA